MEDYDPTNTPDPEDLPIEERIRQRAHELYLARNGGSGSDMDDWLQAEEEIQEAIEQEHEFGDEE